jgi:NAD(P)-dependent dehydrogenase (short-subunit alcohol dehydrogenase family)
MPLLDTNMQNKVCLITGANSGIGKATALGLAQMGATVVMVCRDRARGEEAQREIKMKSGNEAVDLLIADLSSQQSIRQLADTFRQRYPHLHVLINISVCVNNDPGANLLPLGGRHLEFDDRRLDLGNGGLLLGLERRAQSQKA